VLAVSTLASGGESLPVDLCGTWIPDLAAYEHTKELKAPDPHAAPVPPPPPAEVDLPRLRIRKQADAIVFESLDEEGDVISSEGVTADGQQSVRRREEPASRRLSHSRWNGAVLETEWRLVQAGQAIMSGVDSWSLSADGAVLVRASAMEDSKSRSRTKTVYRRAPPRPSCSVELFVEPEQTTMDLTGGETYWSGFTARLRNLGAAPIVLVEPGGRDGPIVSWELVSGEPFDDRRVGCGNINALRADEVFDLEPAETHMLSRMVPGFWVRHPGTYKVRLRYENDPDRRWSGIPLGTHDPVAMQRARKSTPCVAVSNVVEITVRPTP
jgi:hypothetical protein